MFRSKFWLWLALTVPTLVWGHMLQDLLGYRAPAFPGSHWIAPVFGTAVFLYGGLPFLRGAWRELADRLPGMMTLISLAISVAFGFSVAVLAGFPGMPLWEELATLVTVMLLGHGIEMRSIAQAQGALSALARLLPSTATRVIDGRAEEVPIAELREGDTVLAEVLPEQKAERIRELQAGGRRVAMAGDGVNDAPALVNADVGIAIGAGTDVAVEAGGVVLVRSDPRDVVRILHLSRASYRKMVQNLWWAAGYNVVAIPLAAGVLVGQGVLLDPTVGAVLMSASTVIVALNAQLLRRTVL